MKTSSEIIRAFIAVPLPEETTRQISETCEGFLETTKGLKVVRPDNYHLTLAFLGEIDRHLLDYVHESLDLMAKEFYQFNIGFDRISVFPSIIYVKPSKGVEELTDLATAVRAILRKTNIPYDIKPFKGHLTIARVKDRRAKAQDFLKEQALDTPFNIEFRATNLSLIKSDLTPSGPIYSAIRDYILSEKQEEV